MTDIIFFIFLYQRWIYRVDPSRLNEFGVSKEMLEKGPPQAQAAVEGAEGSSVTAKQEEPLAPKSPEEKKKE